MADGYRALINDLAESLLSDPMPGASGGRAQVEEAVARLPELIASGDLDSGLIASLSNALTAHPPAGFEVSEVNLAAARMVADPATTHDRYALQPPRPLGCVCLHRRAGRIPARGRREGPEHR